MLARKGTNLLAGWCLLTTESTKDNVANLYISGVPTAILKSGFIVEEIKANFKTRLSEGRKHGDCMGSACLVPLTGAVQALGADKEAQEFTQSEHSSQRWLVI